MRNGRNRRIVPHGLAAVTFTLALAGSSVAGAIAASASAGDTPIHSASQILGAWRGIWTPRDGLFDKHASAAGYSANSPLIFSACKVESCAWSGFVLGSTNSLPRTTISRFETSIIWRSSFSIAGSRAWSKVIEFSSSGINVRLPLN
jgi:hypothetical protein